MLTISRSLLTTVLEVRNRMVVWVLATITQPKHTGILWAGWDAKLNIQKNAGNTGHWRIHVVFPCDCITAIAQHHDWVLYCIHIASPGTRSQFKIQSKVSSENVSLLYHRKVK